MFRARVMPCLLLQNGALVKTIKFKNPSYVGDPINAIRIFNEKEVDELVILDITATREKRSPPFKILSEIASECFMPVAYGGGIRNLEDMHTIFSLGIEKISLNSYAIENPAFITEAAERFGRQSIVVSIDAKKKMFGGYGVFSHCGTKAAKYTPAEFAKEAERLGAGEILINAIDRDGTQQGYDLELIKSVAEAVGIPVIACGGASKVEDFGAAVKEAGASACAAGSMVVHYGPHRAVLINFPSPAQLDAVLGV